MTDQTAKKRDIRQRQEKDDWMLDFEIRKKEEKKGDYQIQVSALSPQGKALETWLSPDGTGTLRIPDPQLWWVNGLGDQPLYQIRAVLYRNGEPEDCWERRIGLRKMTVRRKKISGGKALPMRLTGFLFLPWEPIIYRRNTCWEKEAEKKPGSFWKTVKEQILT